MPPEPEQLDRDALLMLYAADELPPAQAAALEVQLAADPSLAAQLQQVRDLVSHADDVVRSMDETQRPPVSSAVAVRRAARAMQQWTIDRMRSRIEPEKKTFAIPWWIYPSAAAAILIVGFLVWSGKQEIPSLPAEQPSNVAVDDQPANTGTNTATSSDTDDLANRLDATFANSSVAMAVDQTDSTDDSGAFFLSPREEQAQ